MLKLTSEHTGQPVATVERDSKRDRWFSAEEAKEYGFIDHIVQRLDDIRPTVAARAARF
jgi:ATP-dependent Clp protease, protease subunit